MTDCWRRRAGPMAGAVVVTTLAWAAVSAQIAMPDATQMSGIPIPVAELPVGTVTVRVVRGTLGNNVARHDVTLRAGDKTLTAQTDESGRAAFANLGVGAAIRASAVVDGQTLESQEFPVPAAGGVRVMLVARAATEAAAPGPAPAEPVSGTVVLGGQSRIVVEFGDDGLQVFYLLEIVNSARAPVQTPGPVVFDLPRGAAGAAVLEGSSPQATANGPRILVTPPFKPGTTTVQVGYQLPLSSGALSLTQVFPVALQQLSFVAEKAGQMHVTSPQFATHGDQVIDGKAYVLANGPGLPAGGTLTLEFTGLPHIAVWPQMIALGLAAVALSAGAWAALSAPRARDTVRVQKLVARRDRIFDQLVRVEEQIVREGADATRLARRADLMGQLERLYAELDEGDIALPPRPVPPAGSPTGTPLAERSSALPAK